MVTLKQIAQKAGVSTMTVSRVINKRYSEVSQKNIETIETIIAELGYVPNSSARSLSSNSSKIISIVIQGKANPLHSPYNAIMLGQIIQKVQERGYNAMVHFIEEYAEVTQHLHSWKAEGAIFLGTFDQDIQRIQANNKIPLIFTDSYSTVRQLINIGIDDYKGGVLAAKHFIENGHKHFAFIAPYVNTSLLIKQRLNGFKDTLMNAGLTLLPEYILDAYHIGECADIICHPASSITAIFAATDCCAIEIIDMLKQKNKKVPVDYSVIGFDNLLISQQITPKLTTISQNIEKKAEYSVDILFQHLQNNLLPTQNIVIDVSLVERESVKQL